MSWPSVQNGRPFKVFKMRKKKDVKKKIIEVLRKERKKLLSSKEVAKKVKASYQTILKNLAVLEAEGKIFHKKVGPVKVWFLKK